MYRREVRQIGSPISSSIQIKLIVVLFMLYGQADLEATLDSLKLNPQFDVSHVTFCLFLLYSCFSCLSLRSFKAFYSFIKLSISLFSFIRYFQYD